ncbi:MAG TPA: DNA cytosine methyltransferase [Luteibacter sp.]
MDFFAGGGGASEALRQALGRDPDVAVNHDPFAIGMHAANHPFTRHLPADVWTVDVLGEVAGRSVGWFHASPDCTDFSQAKGGQPRSKAVRSLSWVILKVVGKLARVVRAPRIVSLENVKQILKWGPLVAKRDRATGRVVTLDMVPKVDAHTGEIVMRRGKPVMVHRVAEKGEQVPRRNQFLVPSKDMGHRVPRRRHRRHTAMAQASKMKPVCATGSTWNHFVEALRGLGGEVEWRVVRARDYGAGTTRERLFMVARFDGAPIRWPVPTHGPGRANPYVGMVPHINWNNLGRTIFGRKRPLVRKTILRVLDGAKRGQWPQPYLDAMQALLDGREPRLLLNDAEARDILSRVPDLDAMVMAVGGGGVAHGAKDPGPTFTKGGNGAAPHLFRPALMPLLLGTQGSAAAKPVDESAGTFTTGGATNKDHPGCARPQLFQPIIAPYYGSGSGTTGTPVSMPMPAATTKSRFSVAEPVIVSTCNSNGSDRGRVASDSLPTVTTAKGGDFAVAVPVVTEYRIDILYRMLDAPELFSAQGFPKGYIIDRTADGHRLKVHQAIGMCGNSVSPPPLRAIAEANLDSVHEELAMAA